MPDFLTRFRKRIEGKHGLHMPEDPGWVRERLAMLEDDDEAEDSSGHSETRGEGDEKDETRGGRPNESEERREGGDWNAEEDERGLSVPSSSGRLTPEEAARKLWRTGVLEERIENGFFFLDVSDTSRGQLTDLPPLQDLSLLPDLDATVLLVDDRKDATLGKMKRLVKQMMRERGDGNPVVKIREIAKMVFDFFGGTTLDAPLCSRMSSSSSSSKQLVGDAASGLGSQGGPTVKLLCELESGGCQPRALLFKALADFAGIPSRLQAGLHAPSPQSSAAMVASDPSEHLSPILVQCGVDVVVDLLRRPDMLRPMSSRALVCIHLAGVIDSDSTDSFESPAEPNSPQLHSPDKEGGALRRSPVGLRLQASELPVPTTSVSGQQLASAPHGPPPYAAAPFNVQRSITIASAAGSGQGPIYSGPGLVIPSAQAPPAMTAGLRSPVSEPEGNIFRRRNRRRGGREERVNLNTSPEQVQQPPPQQRPPQAPRGPPEGPPLFTTALDRGSSPEHQYTRSRTMSLLGSQRRASDDPFAGLAVAHRKYLLSEGSDAAAPSPESSNANWMQRRNTFSYRGERSFNGQDVAVTAARELQLQQQLGSGTAGTSGGGSSGFLDMAGDRILRPTPPQRRSGEPQGPRSFVRPTEDRRNRRRNPTPEVSDEVVRMVKEMNATMRREKGRPPLDLVESDREGDLTAAEEFLTDAEGVSSAAPSPDAASMTASGNIFRKQLALRSVSTKVDLSKPSEIFDQMLQAPSRPTPLSSSRPTPSSLRPSSSFSSTKALCPTCRQPLPPPSAPKPRDPSLSDDAAQSPEPLTGREVESFSSRRDGDEQQQGEEEEGKRSEVPARAESTAAGAELLEQADVAAMLANAIMPGVHSASGGTGEEGTVRPNSALLPFDSWKIDYSELVIGTRVGLGSFGEVFRGLWRGTEVAIKMLLAQDLMRENIEDFCHEIALLSRLRHPNVILFMGACIVPPHLSMITEYMHRGALYHIIKRQSDRLSKDRRLKILRDIIRGMMCLQRMNIIHRDLKSANCLVDKHWCVKISDFGLSRIASGENFILDDKGAGTPEWTAPELLRNEPCSFKCDVFSLGVIMWELTTLQRPWDGYSPQEVVQAVALQKQRLEIPPNLMGAIIADCWQEDPNARPDYPEIMARLHECEFEQF